MKFVPTELPEVIVVEPDVWKDNRGQFFESFHLEKFKGGPVPTTFVQDNFSRSVKGVLRGMHTQIKHPQGKLVRAVRGEIFDVAVDVRADSPRFGKWVGVVLSEDNNKAVYVPPGFLHGFCATAGPAEVEYKCTDFYNPADELGIIWNDPTLAIDWPVKDPVLSKKDGNLPTLNQVKDVLKR